ncbi:RNA-binding protein, putative [Bodo saltans]|uniref:RNA-binding protein, putative n=1 Tax=Bodo saltans TaxID=75058 RepID=A0A0S4IWT2_BODSA|nr:RNA-binding protein, putative [Bodo saltans]|eukprot:CUF40140.1 RNA-binding protein, putative [Bodo saltans]
MAKGTVKNRSTPAAAKRRKAQQRIRKKVKVKQSKKEPSWSARMKKTYTAAGKKKTGGDEKGADGKKRRWANEDGDEVQDEVDETKMKRLNERDPLETQLFLKHLPFDLTDAEINDFFKRFGDVRRVLLVRSKATGALSGTGFVHCGTIELVDSIMAVATQNARELNTQDKEAMKEKTASLTHHQAKKAEFKLRADVSQIRDPFLTIRNTRFTVHRVLSRTDSQEVTSAMQKKKKRTKMAADDPRNLYLLQEGYIAADSPAARDLPPQYVQMLQADYEARRETLKNVTMFVSRTRLNVRNLPKKYDERAIRQMFAKAARTYLKTHPEDTDKEHWGKFGPIKNVKLLKDGNGVSKGYAFIEFVNHNVALNSLRQLNNNPTLFGDRQRPVVAFAVENMNAIQKLQRIREIKKNRLASNSNEEEE